MKDRVVIYVAFLGYLATSVFCVKSSDFGNLPDLPRFLNKPLSTSQYLRLQGLYDNYSKRFNMDNRAFGEDDYNRFMDWRSLFGKRSFGGSDRIGFHNMESPFRGSYQNWRERFFPKKKNAEN
ncbi:uncharacterized protein LOC144621325 [Crassostrea virginica]